MRAKGYSVPSGGLEAIHADWISHTCLCCCVWLFTSFMFLISYLFTVIIASELAFLVGKENVFSLADHHCHGFKHSERERRVKWKLRLGELIKLIAVQLCWRRTVSVTCHRDLFAAQSSSELQQLVL